VVTTPAPGTGTQTRHIKSTTRPTIQALPPESYTHVGLMWMAGALPGNWRFLCGECGEQDAGGVAYPVPIAVAVRAEYKYLVTDK
jgi:hypothetical protein